jgi:hypothetical protein
MKFFHLYWMRKSVYGASEFFSLNEVQVSVRNSGKFYTYTGRRGNCKQQWLVKVVTTKTITQITKTSSAQNKLSWC